VPVSAIVQTRHFTNATSFKRVIFRMRHLLNASFFECVIFRKRQFFEWQHQFVHVSGIACFYFHLMLVSFI
jgi:hypothetical protein